MIRRVLVLFGNEACTESLINSAKYLKERYNCEVKGLYVKDVRKHEIIPPSVEGLLVEPSSRYLVEEWDRFENEQIDTLKGRLKPHGLAESLIVGEGITPDVALDTMKGYDLLLVGKCDKVSSNLKYLLKYHYKPFLIISDEEIDLEKPLFANDKGYKSNKSLFRFKGLFDDIMEFTSLCINMSEEKDLTLKEYFEEDTRVLIEKEVDGDPLKVVKKEMKDYGVLIMGDLTHSYMLEKLTGQTGIKIIENIKKPIFIA